MAFNPVERRLLDLCQYWDTFRTDASKRLLIWQVRSNAMRLLQCFFEVQKHETDYTTGDVFIVFDIPFDNSIQYSRALKQSLAGQYAASYEDLRQQGIEPNWQFIPDQVPDSATGFVQSLRSFGSQHLEIPGNLVAVFMPSSIADDNAFAAWLARSLATNLPDNLRLAVTDTIEAPCLTSLINSQNPLVFVDAPKIDALTTAQETFAQENAVGPAAVFRNFLMGLVALVEKGSADQVMVKAGDALAFARKQQWADQEVVVTMLVAGALLKEKRFTEAIKKYQGSRQAAEKAAASGHPAGRELALQTWFGEAGAHLAGGDDVQAAACYDKAAVVAQQIPNFIMAIEAFRMGAFCHTRLNNRNAAIERGALALSLGDSLEPDMRALTTLPIAAVDLLRILEPVRVKRMEEIKHHRDQRQNDARMAAEQRAVALEGSATTQQLRTMEDTLAHDIAQAEHIAVKELETVISGGGKQFSMVFTKAKNLLGEPWPLAISLALPPTPAASGGASS